MKTEIIETELQHYARVSFGEHSGIDVFQHADYSVENQCSFWRTATVNWPGCGSQETEFAQEFTEALQEACKIADDFSAKYAGKMTRGA